MNFNGGTVRDGWNRPDDEAVDDYIDQLREQVEVNSDKIIADLEREIDQAVVEAKKHAA